MNAGNLKNILHFYTFTEGKNKLGDVRKCAKYLFSAWAQIKDESSSKNIKKAKEQNAITVRIKVRYDNRYHAGLVAVYNNNSKTPPANLKHGICYELGSVCDESGNKKELELKATTIEKRDYQCIN